MGNQSDLMNNLIETLQDIHDVAECRIRSGDKRGVVYIPPDKLQDFNIAIAALEEIQQYHALGTVEELQEAGEKQRAKKPANVEEDYFVCPRCGAFITALDDFSTHKYCLNCGQAIDWSKGK